MDERDERYSADFPEDETRETQTEYEGNPEDFDPDEQYNRIKEQTRRADEERKSPRYLRKERDRKWDMIRRYLMYLCLVLAGVSALLLYVHNYRFTTYSVDSETKIASGENAGVFAFKDGNVVVSADSVSYVVNEQSVFMTALSVRNPVFVSEGDYFALFTMGGYRAYIGDATGILATIKVSRGIRCMDISAAGVTAVCTESEDTAFITYYDRYGTHIAVDVKTALNLSGYPVNLSVSPDGQKLAVIYYTVANGIGESRLVFYDFEHGRPDKSYVIQAFEDFYEDNTFLVSCAFTDNKHVTVVGDNRMLFLSYNGVDNVTRQEITLNDTVRSVYHEGADLIVVTGEGEHNRCNRYDLNGRLRGAFDVDTDYDTVCASDRFVVFKKGAHIVYYNASGKLRYEGDLVREPVSIAFFGKKSLLVNTGTMLQKITLK